MTKHELLVPAGDMECLYQAISNGADAVYLGCKSFGARKFARNFDNEEIIKKVTKALYKGQQWVKTHTAREIAEVISPFFTDISIDDLTVVMQRHIDIDAWKDTPHLYEDDFNRLMDIMIEAKELNSKAPYDKLVTKKYADLIVNKK